jgi:hypothetical protein
MWPPRRGGELLDERGLVHPQVEPTRVGRRLELLLAVEPLDARPAPADVRLHQHRVAEPTRRRHRLRRAVHHPRAGVGEAERVEQVELERLRRLDLVRPGPVHHGHADALEVPQPVQGVEGRLLAPSQIRRRRSAVEHERVRHALLGRIEPVLPRVDALERDAPTLELGEERAEPVGVLVEDRYRERHGGRCG